MRIVSIVGARPQFIKAAVICRAISEICPECEHQIIHTGQHYDNEMSQRFFDELDLPVPINLRVGSGLHGAQTGEMLKRLETALVGGNTDWILGYGDTNSTMAAAIVAAKLNIPLGHVEAGLRSYNRRMPEEVNRIVADHLASALFCPTETAVANLAREGLADRALMTGDVMFDAALMFRRLAEARKFAVADIWKPRQFALATVHRAENTDNPKRLLCILNALDRVASEVCPVIFPVHPRTRLAFSALGWAPRAIAMVSPLPYLEMLILEARARMILTDSGGVQKEAYFFHTPCITLRDETEWLETLENGCNVLVGASGQNIEGAVGRVEGAGPWEAFYGQGDAGQRIVKAIIFGQSGSPLEASRPVRVGL